MTKHYVLHAGCGIQSTTLHLMFVLEEIPQKLDYTIFPDTGAEPQPLYRHLQLLHSFAGPHNYAPSRANLANEVPGTRHLLARLPAHTPESPRAGCLLTRDYKLEVLIQQIRDSLGVKDGRPFPHVSVILYLAVTYDQRSRAELIRRRLADYSGLRPSFRSLSAR
jgi:hypothetical protein